MKASNELNGEVLIRTFLAFASFSFMTLVDVKFPS